jgi:hypothetical protein
MHLVNPYISFPAAGGVGGTTPFADNFDDNSIDPALWEIAPYTNGASQTGVTVSETSQHLEISPPASTSGTHYNSLLSVPSMDFRGKTLEVDIVQYLNNTTESAIQIEDAADPGGKYVYTYFSFGAVYWQTEPTNSFTNDTLNKSITKWRIKHNDPANTWEFSSYLSGVWTVQFTSAAESWTPSAVKFRLWAGTFQSTTPGQFILDNVSSDALY